MPEWLISKKLMIACVEKDIDKGEHSFTAGESANLYSHFDVIVHQSNQCGSFTENWGLTYLKTHQYHKDTCSTIFIAA